MKKILENPLDKVYIVMDIRSSLAIIDIKEIVAIFTTKKYAKAFMKNLPKISRHHYEVEEHDVYLAGVKT